MLRVGVPCISIHKFCGHGTKLNVVTSLLQQVFTLNTRWSTYPRRHINKCFKKVDRWYIERDFFRFMKYIL